MTKKRIVFKLAILVGFGMSPLAFAEQSNENIPALPTQNVTDDLGPFLEAINSLNESFSKDITTSSQAFQEACAMLKSRFCLDVALQGQAQEAIQKSQADIEQIKEIVLRFQNSNNVYVKKLCKEFIILHDCAWTMFEYQSHFLSSPSNFSPADTNILLKSSLMFAQQCKRIDTLIRAARDAAPGTTTTPNSGT